MVRAGRLWGAVATVVAACCAVTPPFAGAADDILIRGATVVTMDADHTVIPRGRVLVSGPEIGAVWRPGHRPARIDGHRLGRAEVVQPGRDVYVFPGLVSLHDHPTYDMLEP